MTIGRAAALLLCALLAAPLPAAASGERVDAMGRAEYLRDEENDLDLNPAFAAFAGGDRLFVNAGAILSGSRINSLTQKRKSQGMFFVPSGEYLDERGDWAWAARWSPAYDRSRTEVRNYNAAGVLTSRQETKSKTVAPGQGRLLAARKLENGALGAAVEYAQQSAQTIFVGGNRQESKNRFLSSDLGWIGGKPGGRQAAVTVGGDYFDIPSDNTGIGNIQQDISTARLRVLPQGPWEESKFLRGKLEAIYSRSRVRYPASFSLAGQDSEGLNLAAGAGFEAVAGPRTRWTAMLEATATPFNKDTETSNLGVPDVVSKAHAWGSTLRFGVEHLVAGGVTVRGRADFLQWQWVQSRTNDGTSGWSKTLNGPLEALVIGLGYTPRPDVTLDFSVLTDYAQWVNRGGGNGPGLSSEERTWNLSFDAVMTVRFGEKAGTAAGKRP